jgi:hypothetical protein
MLKACQTRIFGDTQDKDILVGLLQELLISTQSDPDQVAQLDLYHQDSVTVRQEVFGDIAKRLPQITAVSPCWSDLTDLEKIYVRLVHVLTTAIIFETGYLRLTNIAAESLDRIAESWESILNRAGTYCEERLTLSDIKTRKSTMNSKPLNVFSESNIKATGQREAIPYRKSENRQAPRLDLRSAMDLKLTEHSNSLRKVISEYKAFTKELLIHPVKGLERKDRVLNSVEISEALYRKIKKNVVQTSEYPIDRALQVLVALMMEHEKSVISAKKHIVFDPCAGWGNRSYAALALMQLGKVERYFGSDPNMINNGIEAYLSDLSATGAFSDGILSQRGWSEYRKNIHLETHKIGENLERARAGALPSNVTVMFSCSPYAPTQVKNGQPTTKLPENDTAFVEDYSFNSETITREEFVTEFDWNLAELAARVMAENGYLAIQFNREHGEVFASILASAYTYFSDVEIFPAEHFITKSEGQKSPPNQVLVVAKRTNTPITKNVLSNRTDGIRDVETFKNLIHPANGKISCAYRE